MAEYARQSQGAGMTAAPCADAAGAHIDRWGEAGPATRASEDVEPSRRNIRAGAGSETVWGGDLDDPRLFYFRALLASDRFFSGVRRA